MKFPYNITITHLSTTALCTTPFLMIACFTLGNSINGCSISTCHHTMSKFQCSNYPSPYFLTQKNASHSGSLSTALLARTTILCQIAKLAQDWKQRGGSLCLQLIVCTKSMVVLCITTCHHKLSSLCLGNCKMFRTSRPSVTISKYSIILTCPKYSRYPQFPHVPYIQHRNFHYISLVVHDWFISDYVGLRELTTSPAAILRVAKAPSPRPGDSPTLQQGFILASLTAP